MAILGIETASTLASVAVVRADDGGDTLLAERR